MAVYDSSTLLKAIMTNYAGHRHGRSDMQYLAPWTIVERDEWKRNVRGTGVANINPCPPFLLEEIVKALKWNFNVIV
jgi:hypothetical protein